MNGVILLVLANLRLFILIEQILFSEEKHIHKSSHESICTSET